ncbi:MAG: ATP-dependent RecD-like DNA helicase, partial [Planctomycetaceae bacterium]|nr:ATP-dependent RecD-like DNA helicase [Planctomycetaceae bacterium]
YRTYGERAIEVIKQNPYQLADDIRGIGFQSADDLARSLGLDPQSLHRARAAVRYVLQELTYKQGHCGFPETGVVAEAEQLVSIDRTILENAIEQEIADEKLVREKQDDEAWLFLTRLHQAETELAESVRRILNTPGHPLPKIDIEAAIGWVQQKLNIELASGQQSALHAACRERLVIITGGPGVGKTTLVRSLLEVFEAKNLRCVLAAPTGRAAKRMTETTGRPAKTLHRLLEFDPVVFGFKKNAATPLSGDVFVLDECSMIDVLLAWQFFAAVPENAAVVMVGDVDQLPSVGPGSVLSDLIHSRQITVARLTEIFRQAQSSRIVSAAHAINEGTLPDLESPPSNLTDFYFTECDTPEAIERMIVRLVQERIPDRFGFSPLTDVQILTPMNGSSLGTRNLNQVLQAALNPKQKQREVVRFGITYRVGDRVIQTENNYDRNVFNGDLGTVQHIDPVEQELLVQFEDREVTYDFTSLDELALAYVLTIHKSQGSEYPCVIIPLHTQHFLMLRRNLLYTGLTRGKQLVIIVGSRKALEIAIGRTETHHRLTTLAKRLR